MPTYQYTCTDCGEPVEAVQKFTDDPLTVCAACGGRLRKVFSPVGIVFKGSGFYRTDSRNGSGSRSEAANGKQPSEPRRGSGAVARADAVLVPALAVDRAGNRLGRGGGSFDRALARVGPLIPLIALLYDDELVEQVPTAPHDIPVRAAVTPRTGITRLAQA